LKIFVSSVVDVPKSVALSSESIHACSECKAVSIDDQSEPEKGTSLKKTNPKKNKNI
jgi:hypothetical protein